MSVLSLQKIKSSFDDLQKKKTLKINPDKIAVIREFSARLKDITAINNKDI